MSETSPEQVKGPVMINATRVLKNEGTRIGRISKDITLPRTVRLVAAVGVGIGAFVGLILGLIFGGSLQNIAYVMVVTGGIGYLATSYSPLKGESLATWLSLQVTSALSSKRIDGKPVQLSVGVAPASRLASGKVQLKRSAVKVSPGTVDERGVLVDPKNRYRRSS